MLLLVADGGGVVVVAHPPVADGGNFPILPSSFLLPGLPTVSFWRDRLADVTTQHYCTIKSYMYTTYTISIPYYYTLADTT